MGLKVVGWGLKVVGCGFKDGDVGVQIVGSGCEGGGLRAFVVEVSLEKEGSEL